MPLLPRRPRGEWVQSPESAEPMCLMHPNYSRVTGAAFPLPALQNPCNNRIETLLEPGLALSGIVPASVGVTPDEPYRIGRSEALRQRLKPPGPDLIECPRTMQTLIHYGKAPRYSELTEVVRDHAPSLPSGRCRTSSTIRSKSLVGSVASLSRRCSS